MGDVIKVQFRPPEPPSAELGLRAVGGQVIVTVRIPVGNGWECAEFALSPEQLIGVTCAAKQQQQESGDEG